MRPSEERGTRPCYTPRMSFRSPVARRRALVLAGERTVLLLAVSLGVAGVAASGGCRRAAPEVAPASPALGSLAILKDGRYLFTYLEPAGAFATTDKPEIIPEASRKIGPAPWRKS